MVLHFWSGKVERVYDRNDPGGNGRLLHNRFWTLLYTLRFQVLEIADRHSIFSLLGLYYYQFSGLIFVYSFSVNSSLTVFKPQKDESHVSLFFRNHVKSSEGIVLLALQLAIMKIIILLPKCGSSSFGQF